MRFKAMKEIEALFKYVSSNIYYICHDRTSNLTEFQILLTELPIGSSVDRASNSVDRISNPVNIS